MFQSSSSTFGPGGAAHTLTCHFQFRLVRNQEIGFYRRYSFENRRHSESYNGIWRSNGSPINFNSNDKSKLMLCLCKVHPYTFSRSHVYAEESKELEEKRRSRRARKKMSASSIDLV